MTTTTTATYRLNLGDNTMAVIVEETSNDRRSTFVVKSAKTWAVQGYVFRQHSYNAHSDWGSRTLDGKREFLGDNLTVKAACERVCSL